ncbi:MAG: MiaB/RimO family radical SAM methylthiotransferase [Lentisphaerae bacterium]|nr:MiaB/RimO family radical SAM methylthiotransferase [Lentisphaerota bacterium]
MPLRVAFTTIGCRLNQAETAAMAGRFQAAGYTVVPSGNACEVHVVHSCTVTARAERDSLRAARRAARQQPRPLVVVAGCAVEADPERVRTATGADRVVGHDGKRLLPDGLPRAPAGAQHTPGIPVFASTRALVKIQDGCSFGCAYCIVPRVRSRVWSRPVRDVLEECRALAGAGHREIVLTGANLGTFRDGRRSLVHLLEAIESRTPVARIRLSSIEPATVEREIIDYMAGSERVCRYLHLPLQSGDDNVLAAMGRHYTAADYTDRAAYAIERIPRLGLGTDIITGLPGEDAEAFKRTRDLVAGLPFSNLHVFPYSPRPGTRAAALQAPSPATARRRARDLVALGRKLRRTFAARAAGRPVTVLVETVSENAGYGWTGEYLRARIRRPGLRVNTLLTLTVPRHGGLPPSPAAEVRPDRPHPDLIL